MNLTFSAALRSLLLLLALDAACGAPEQVSADPARGRAFFLQNCALCHTTVLGPGGQPISGQGPSLVGLIGRQAASLDNFGYSKALRASGIRWDAAALDHFLQAPSVAVPGTLMPVPVPNAADRQDLIEPRHAGNPGGGDRAGDGPAPWGGRGSGRLAQRRAGRPASDRPVQAAAALRHGVLG